MNKKVEELKERIVENETKVERSGVIDDKGNVGVVVLRNKRKLMQDEVIRSFTESRRLIWSQQKIINQGMHYLCMNCVMM